MFSENEKLEKEREQKLEAGRLLGIRYENLTVIPKDERTKEALLVTIEIIKEAHLAVLESKDAANNSLQKKIKSLLTGRARANTRADSAEAKLKIINRAIRDDFH